MIELVFTPGTENGNRVIDSHTRGYPGTRKFQMTYVKFHFPSTINADNPLFCAKHTGSSYLALSFKVMLL